MKTTFNGEIEVLVFRNGREIARVVRPLRQTPKGPVVRYKRQLWPVNGNCINISARPFDAELEVNPTVASEATELLAPSSDDGQQAVIGAPASERILVAAGPGTGKTHVACNRIAAIVGDDLSAARIWIISFTRTAVHEIRNRLIATLEDTADAAAVKIATLDSVAWTVHSGFSKDTVFTGSYDENIEQTLRRIKEDEEVQDHFQRLRHLIVDEAQDIVGVRADLVLAIVDALTEDCGVTVFADEAQAIYGFTEDTRRVATPGTRLVEELGRRGFKTVSLDRVHRTDSPTLLKIFTEVRKRVLDRKAPAAARGPLVRSEITRLADAKVGEAKKLDLSKLPENGLVLMRQRCDVLLASSYNQDKPHRLRMSGLPARVLPWVGFLLWDYPDRRLTRSVYDQRWKQVAVMPGAPQPEIAWRLLFEAAGESETVIDVHRLRTVLGRPNPPSMFTSPEFGDSGPVIGTIHASKGREAEEVCLYLPPESDDGDAEADADEEIRVMFVGATRARKKLSIGDSPGRQSRNCEGRVWKGLTGGRVQVEVGRAYDIDARGLVGKSTFTTAADALRAQRFLFNNPVLSGLFASTKAELGWKFALETKEKLRIGALSEKVGSDLKAIAGFCESWPPPKYLPHIRSMGLRTIALRSDDPVLEQLHEPWHSTGFLLAPMLIGFSVTGFK